MLIAVTGHTSGIGLAITNYFANGGNTVLGFSRRNGYNISDPDSRQKIIMAAADCTIFVNNAYQNFDDGQLALLEGIWNSWSGLDNKIIINISTRWTTDVHPYCLTKLAQDKFCLSKVGLKPAIINFKPGWIDTPRVATFKNKKMKPELLIEILDFVLKNYKRHEITSITFGV